MVHCNMETPGLMFVTVVFLRRGLVIVPVPETNDQEPVPTAGRFPASVAVTVPVVAQRVCDGPAFEIEGVFVPTTIMLSSDEAQGAFEIVQRKVLLPTPKPVIVVFGLLGETIVPDPPSNVHSPVPAVGVFAAITALDEMQTVWSGPAEAIEGTARVVILIFETEEAQGGLLIDHVSTVTPGVKPVTVVFLRSGFVITPGPETLTHVPVPEVGLFPFKVVEPVVVQMV